MAEQEEEDLYLLRNAVLATIGDNKLVSAVKIKVNDIENDDLLPDPVEYHEPCPLPSSPSSVPEDDLDSLRLAALNSLREKSKNQSQIQNESSDTNSIHVILPPVVANSPSQGSDCGVVEGGVTSRTRRVSLSSGDPTCDPPLMTQKNDKFSRYDSSESEESSDDSSMADSAILSKDETSSDDQDKELERNSDEEEEEEGSPSEEDGGEFQVTVGACEAKSLEEELSNETDFVKMKQRPSRRVSLSDRNGAADNRKTHRKDRGNRRSVMTDPHRDRPSSDLRDKIKKNSAAESPSKQNCDDGKNTEKFRARLKKFQSSDIPLERKDRVISLKKIKSEGRKKRKVKLKRDDDKAEEDDSVSETTVRVLVRGHRDKDLPAVIDTDSYKSSDLRHVLSVVRTVSPPGSNAIEGKRKIRKVTIKNDIISQDDVICRGSTPVEIETTNDNPSSVSRTKWRSVDRDDRGRVTRNSVIVKLNNHHRRRDGRSIQRTNHDRTQESPPSNKSSTDLRTLIRKQDPEPVLLPAADSDLATFRKRKRKMYDSDASGHEQRLSVVNTDNLEKGEERHHKDRENTSDRKRKKYTSTKLGSSRSTSAIKRDDGGKGRKRSFSEGRSPDESQKMRSRVEKTTIKDNDREKEIDDRILKIQERNAKILKRQQEVREETNKFISSTIKK